MSGDDFLSRWSRRKHEARGGARQEEPAPPSLPPASAQAAPAPAEPRKEPPPLPPVESLTPESDFTPFMRSEVDPGVRQQALRTLFRDPRFNVMDGLDVYIDDYSKPDPIPADWLGKLNQLARLGDFRLTEAKREEAEATPQDGAPVENAMEEQPLAAAAEAHPSDTPAAGSTLTGLKES